MGVSGVLFGTPLFEGAPRLGGNEWDDTIVKVLASINEDFGTN
jgi:hypothetical protein